MLYINVSTRSLTKSTRHPQLCGLVTSQIQSFQLQRSLSYEPAERVQPHRNRQSNMLVPNCILEAGIKSVIKSDNFVYNHVTNRLPRCQWQQGA